jgi:AraC-like DNA-binding protein
LIEDRVLSSTLPLARRIPGNGGPGVALYRVSASLYQEAEISKAQGDTAELDAYFKILSACIGHPGADLAVGQPGAELSSRVQNFIETHLTDPTMGPAEIASAVGISVRHLHRLFSLRAHTVGDWIRWRRLQQCRRELANPHLREKTITEIAFFWGFSDSAHFSHCFRQQFGTCPRTFRSWALPGQWNTGDVECQDLLPTAMAGRRYPAKLKFKPN